MTTSWGGWLHTKQPSIWIHGTTNLFTSSQIGVHLWCCLSPSDLRFHFVNEMERGTDRFNGFQITPSGAVYHVKNIVNVLLQILLRYIPSCEGNLVEDWIMFRFSFIVSGILFTFVELSGLLLLKATRLHCGRRRMLRCTTISTFEASKLDGLNCQHRGTSYYVLK